MFFVMGVFYPFVKVSMDKEENSMYYKNKFFLIATSLKKVKDSRGSRQVDMQACLFGSLLAEMNKNGAPVRWKVAPYFIHFSQTLIVVCMGKF